MWHPPGHGICTAVHPDRGHLHGVRSCALTHKLQLSTATPAPRLQSLEGCAAIALETTTPADLLGCRWRHTTVKMIHCGCPCVLLIKPAVSSLQQSGASGCGCHATGLGTWWPAQGVWGHAVPYVNALIACSGNKACWQLVLLSQGQGICHQAWHGSCSTHHNRALCLQSC